jgi:hypothetical protein
MPSMKQVVEMQVAVQKGDPGPPNYCQFLLILEKQDQFKSVKKLHQKIMRQRKEI